MPSLWLKANAWKQRAPLCVAAALACLAVSDATLRFWSFVRMSRGSGHGLPTLAARTGGRSVSLPQLMNAHLFGETPVAVSQSPPPGGVLPTANDYNLSGIIAMREPADGYAILGPKGESTRLYRVGATIEGLAGGRLYQVFADHVVLELSGVFKILRLPMLLGPNSVRPIHSGALARAGDAGRQAQATPISLEANQQLVSAAQTLFSDFDAEQNSVNGHAVVMLHPSRAYQRKYGLHDGDVLTSVNGVVITSADALNALLNGTDSRSLTLVYSRNGQDYTVGMQASN
jgi:type II secretory pathway component PulC